MTIPKRVEPLLLILGGQRFDKMRSYILKRLLFVVPTLFVLLSVTFLLTQFAPGGPLDFFFAKLQGGADEVQNHLAEGGMMVMEPTPLAGDEALSQPFLEEMRQHFGFDKPPFERYLHLIGAFLRLDFGRSYFRDARVIDLIWDRMPTSFTLSFLAILLIYGISIPLGIRKAIKKGARFDRVSTFLLALCYAVPSFLMAILLVVLFAGGSFWDLFPLRGLFSEGWQSFSLFEKVKDYLWHLCLPVTVLVLSHLATKTLIVKNAFLEEFYKKYILTARAKGVGPTRILYGHIFKNAVLPLIANFPSHFVHLLFKNTLVIEIVFSIDGLGLLAYEAAISRDYPILLGLIFMMASLSIFFHLVGDILYGVIDKRIRLERQQA